MIHSSSRTFLIFLILHHSLFDSPEWLKHKSSMKTMTKSGLHKHFLLRTTDKITVNLNSSFLWSSIKEIRFNIKFLWKSSCTSFLKTKSLMRYNTYMICMYIEVGSLGIFRYNSCIYPFFYMKLRILQLFALPHFLLIFCLYCYFSGHTCWVWDLALIYHRPNRILRILRILPGSDL